MDSPFDHLRARGLVVVTLVGAYLGASAFSGVDGVWHYLLADIAAYLVILLGLCWLCRLHHVNIKQIVGRSEASIPVGHLTVSVVLPVIVLSFGATWMLFWPLSYVTPELVEWWLLDYGGVLIWEDGKLPLLPNIVNFLILVALAPICEEFLFRGLLFHRWIRKWSVMHATILSSILFGLGHADVLGAFLFGYVMCVLYLQTKTLLVPITAHALNNMLVWSFTFFESAINESEYTLSMFQSEWWLGIGCIVLSAPWLTKYFRENRPLSKWEIPYVANQSVA